MQKEPEKTIYDIAIIGGGIAGAAIARDAVLRGLSVVLFEKNTFGSGTSSKSSKLIHGGIRYLEIAWLALKRRAWGEFWKNFKFVFFSLRETHRLVKIGGGLVRPISLVIPIYKAGGRKPMTVIFGAVVYGLMSLLTGGRHLPRILWTKKAVLALLPALNPENLTCGVIIWDHTTDDRKLVQTTAVSAIQNGAQALEYARVLKYQFNTSAEVYEIAIEQRGKAANYRARKLINASGPWVDQIRTLGGEYTEDFLAPVAGSHITFDQLFKHSVILEAEDKRIFFVINRHGTSRVGTTEWIYDDPDTLTTPDEDVTYLLKALHHHFPGLNLKPHQIIDKDSGIRPLARPKAEASPSNISREHEIRIGPTGVIHVLGVKLTDHRRAAAEIVDKLVPEIKRWNPRVKSKTLTHRTKLIRPSKGLKMNEPVAALKS